MTPQLDCWGWRYIYTQTWRQLTFFLDSPVVSLSLLNEPVFHYTFDVIDDDDDDDDDDDLNDDDDKDDNNNEGNKF